MTKQKNNNEQSANINNLANNTNLTIFEKTCEHQLNNFNDKFNISNSNIDKKSDTLNRKMSNNTNGKTTRLQDIKRKKTLFNNPVLQLIKNLTV